MYCMYLRLYLLQLLSLWKLRSLKTILDHLCHVRVHAPQVSNRRARVRERPQIRSRAELGLNPSDVVTRTRSRAPNALPPRHVRIHLAAVLRGGGIRDLRLFRVSVIGC